MVWISKSGLEILIRAPKVPYLVPRIRRKWVVFALLGTKKWDFGCPNQNSETTFRDPKHQQNQHLDTLGTFLALEKCFFAFFFINFAHFWLLFSV